MNGDDIEPVLGPNFEEIMAIWAQVIHDLKDMQVCFYPGQANDAGDFVDFPSAIALIGNCEALILADPQHTRDEVLGQVNGHRDNLRIPIPGMGFVTEIEIVNTGNVAAADHDGLFHHPPTNWIPPATYPPEDRFWGLYYHWTISGRVVHLLHIGIAGDAAWIHFFQPHGIVPARIIANPPWEQQQ